RQFHNFMLGRHFNSEAARIMQTQNGWLRLLTASSSLHPSQMRRSSEEHWELLAAIRNCDTDRAADTIRKHIERSKEIHLARMHSRESQNYANAEELPSR